MTTRPQSCRPGSWRGRKFSATFTPAYRRCRGCGDRDSEESAEDGAGGGTIRICSWSRRQVSTLTRRVWRLVRLGARRYDGYSTFYEIDSERGLRVVVVRAVSCMSARNVEYDSTHLSGQSEKIPAAVLWARRRILDETYPGVRLESCFFVACRCDAVVGFVIELSAGRLGRAVPGRVPSPRAAWVERSAPGRSARAAPRGSPSQGSRP